MMISTYKEEYKTMKEQWKVYAKKADFNRIASEYGITPILARIIRNRDIIGEKQIQTYLYGTVNDLHSPRQMKDIEKAARLIKQAIEKQIKILVASDYDDDGIFASMILYEAIQSLGGRVTVDMPSRIKEGYGLNERMVEEAYEQGVGMIVTCDNGIAAVEAIRYAKLLGMQVIVTDHHEVPFQEQEGIRTYFLPDADAIVNPKQNDCSYPFKGLCGAGVAYKLVQVLYEDAHKPVQQLYQFLEYAAIATVADVMDLVEENRIIVKEGLKRLRKTENIGLLAIMEASNIVPSQINSYHIGFVIGPAFNAAGRLETAQMAVDLLRETDCERARQMAVELKQLNDQRKDMTAKGVEDAVAIIEQSDWKKDRVLLVYLKDCHESIAGIIAGRLRERYYRPVYVFTDAEQGIKGSGRSIEGYHMFEGLIECKQLLDRFGGHAMAAGLSLKKENLERLRYHLNKNCTVKEDVFIPKVMIDVPMPLSYISEAFVEQLQYLEPFGKGNQKPLFARQHFRILSARIIGKNQNVCKMRVADTDGVTMDALYFGDISLFLHDIEMEYGKQEVEKMMRGAANAVDMAFTYYPSMNEFRGVRTLQIVVQNYCRIS